MADRITALAPRPRFVTLGDTDYPVWEARLLELIELQGWLDDQWTDPLDEVEERIAVPSLSEEERHTLIVDARESLTAPIADGSPEAAQLLGSDEGICVFLSVALKRGTPGLTWDDIANIASEMTGPQYSKLRRVFYGISSGDVLTRLLIGGESTEDPDWSWGWAIDDLARTHHWTYKEIYAMALTEFVNARRQGEKREEGIALKATTEQELAEKLQGVTAKLYGKTPDELWGDEQSEIDRLAQEQIRRLFPEHADEFAGPSEDAI